MNMHPSDYRPVHAHTKMLWTHTCWIRGRLVVIGCFVKLEIDHLDLFPFREYFKFIIHITYTYFLSLHAILTYY